MDETTPPRALLTRAADLIEERAASAGVWPRELHIPKAMLDGTAKHWGRDPDEVINEILWIITVPPAVAPPLVAWLRREAEAGGFLDSDGRLRTTLPAIAFALTVLGMEALEGE